MFHFEASEKVYISEHLDKTIQLKQHALISMILKMGL